MTRKLTANQIIHGARAYSHNASRRAHQLSGPRRERVVCEPVSTPWLSAAINEGIRIGRTDDKPCKCGTLVCGYRGPCARVVEAPRPSPAPVVERQPHRFVVGQRVRVTGDSAGLLHRATGAEGVIMRWSNLGTAAVRFDTRNANLYVGAADLEPVEPLTSERGAQESDEALLLRCGWTRLPDSDGSGACEYAFGKTPYGSHDRVVTASWPNREMFGAHTNGSDMVEGGLRTLLQAACAALGITLERSPGAPSLWDARLGDALIVHSADDPESCARAAVEAWSAMQREGASDGK